MVANALLTNPKESVTATCKYPPSSKASGPNPYLSLKSKNAARPSVIYLSSLPAPLTASIPFSTRFSSQLNGPHPSSSSIPPIVANALLTKPRVSVIATCKYPPSWNALSSRPYLFFKSKNAARPFVISFNASPDFITDLIPLSVALGLNVFPNIAPNNPPGLAGSPPACANAPLTEPKAIPNCFESCSVKSNF